jgi:hypothetical protein
MLDHVLIILPGLAVVGRGTISFRKTSRIEPAPQLKDIPNIEVSCSDLIQTLVGLEQIPQERVLPLDVPFV